MHGIYVSAAGAQAFNDYMEVLSNNLANVDTPGFRRELAVIQARATEAIEQGLDVPGNGSLNQLPGGVRMVETKTDFQQGTLKETGSDTDLAIADQTGDSFFVVAGDGERYLTRAGNFAINALGQLVTQDGFNLLAGDGTPVQVDPSFGIQVTSEGFVTQPETGLSVPLALERPQSLGDLTQAGMSRFRPLAPTSPVHPTERAVKQGYLEHSSSRPIQEMTQMIQVSRAYEANVRMIQTQDGATGALINRVLGQS